MTDFKPISDKSKKHHCEEIMSKINSIKYCKDIKKIIENLEGDSSPSYKSKSISEDIEIIQKVKYSLTKMISVVDHYSIENYENTLNYLHALKEIIVLFHKYKFIFQIIETYLYIKLDLVKYISELYLIIFVLVLF